jgi:hypothetical protein
MAFGQTGTGVVLITDGSYQFTPTTVDSTSTFDFQLTNTVGVAQTVYFGGLSTPFALINNAPVEVAPQDTIDLSISFTPESTGNHSDTLEVIGGIFGSAELIVSGNGIQVQLSWTPEILVFDTTAIGQSNSQTLSLSSIGNGDAIVSAIEFSSSSFTIDSTQSSFIILEGATENIVVNYAPINAGSLSEFMTLHTNDPTNPTIAIGLTAVGISEISGEICNQTLTLNNSPYTLVGNLVIPDGCTLNIDAGVEVIGNDFTIQVLGALFANGEEGNEIQIEVGELLSHTSAENMLLLHCNVVETLNSSYVFGIDGGTYSSIMDNENSSDHIGKYFENFSDGTAQGYSYSGSMDSWGVQGTSYLQLFYDGNSSSYYTSRLISPLFELNPGEYPTRLEYRLNRDNTYDDGANDYIRIYAIVNGDQTLEIDYIEEHDLGWTYFEFDSHLFNDFDSIQSLKVYWESRYRYRSYLRVDDFTLETNYYPGFDVPLSEANNPSDLSTGGITLTNSTYLGDFRTTNDSLTIEISNSSLHPNQNRIKSSDGLALSGNYAFVQIDGSDISGHSVNGCRFNSLSTKLDLTNSEFSSNGKNGISQHGLNSIIEVFSEHLTCEENGNCGIRFQNNASGQITGGTISGNFRDAIECRHYADLDLRYLFLDDNGGNGVEIQNEGFLSLKNCRIQNNGLSGVLSSSATFVDHCNLAFNEETGLVLTGNNFHTLNNSILWGNNSTNYTQIDIAGGVISTSFSTVQGRSNYGVSGSGQFYWGEGVIEADPLFADDELHLEIYSPCVDGGQTWHQDEHMPFGLGGVRADMGMYGGPNNAFWGGEALPDGASALTGVSDSPQDQGGVVGLVFDASFYDNSDLVNNVTSYAFWRHYDPTGQSIYSLDEGNWELIGEMPAQSFSGYAFQATTLGNTNIFGTFNSCYTVVAHTDDPDTYWYSNVLCGESIDNLSPSDPDLGGMVLENGDAVVFWEAPFEEDYAYTQITSDAGFVAEISNDTLAVDISVEAGGTYTYTAIHYDVNGNPSNPSSVTLEIGVGLDLIELHAGWNLISTDRAVNQAIDEVFANLEEDNLLYVTGFNGGVEFYDPDGLSFLNTLNELTPGLGYWVKVESDDVLEVSGVRLSEDFMPGLVEGWNLVGYAAETPAHPSVVFDELVSTGNLLYVTGFDQGVQVYDPNGLPFLNSLQEMRNGFGYWVKSAVSTEGDVLLPLGDKLPAEVPSPVFDILNGTSDLASYAGGFVEVVNLRGDVISHLPILEGGLLMTTPIYGDDPSTLTREGVEFGEQLRFRFRGKLSEIILLFDGGMAHKELELSFGDIDDDVTAFPNPATDESTINFFLEKGSDVQLAVFGAQGRQVAEHKLSGLSSGINSIPIPLNGLNAGIYTISVSDLSGNIGSARLVILR